MSDVDLEVAAMTDEAALPRKNGELVFEAPWEGRAFGLGVALCERGHYPWRDFQASLIDAVAVGTPGERERRYYEHWLAALEKLLVGRGVLDPAEIERRTAEYLSGERDPLD